MSRDKGEKGVMPYVKMGSRAKEDSVNAILHRRLADGDFPMTRGEVARRVGDETLQDDEGNDFRLHDVLMRVEDDRFASLGDLISAVQGVLGEHGLEGRIRDPHPEQPKHPHA